MTRQTHQIFCAPSKKYVALEGSKEVFQTNGSGTQPPVALRRTITRYPRFITAIFLHAGFIHILLNMLAQLTISAQVTIMPYPIGVTKLPLDGARDGFRGIYDYLLRCRNLWVC
jgi:hypothetical protein